MEEKRQEQEENTVTTEGKKDAPGYQQGFKKGMLTMALICLAIGLGAVILFWVLGRESQSGDERTETVQPPQESTVVSEELTESEDIENTDQEVGDASEADDEKARIQDKMDQIQSLIDEYYLFEQDPEWIEEGIYAGMMAGLGDVYSYYYTKEDLEAMMESVEGEYCGIGVMVSQNMTTGVITVTKVFSDAPGEEAGMLPEDIIVRVDGTDISGMLLDMVVNQYVKGEEGTPVTITVYRPSIEDYLDLTMTRRLVEAPSVEYQMLEDQIGLVTISSFDMMTPSQFRTAVDTLQDQGMKKMIVDLRGNPGGALDAVVDVLDYLLPDHLGIYARTGDYTSLIYTEDKDGNGESYSAGDGHEMSLPTAVLINGNSASAAEVFAGAMQDYGWGTLVGTTSFGKGIVQQIMSLEDGSGINLTVSRYYTPSGRNIHGIGITPDVEVELDEELATRVVIDPAEDNQIQAAVQLLNTGKGLKKPVTAERTEARVYADGKEVCQGAAHMAFQMAEIETGILAALEESGYSIFCQMDYASEETLDGVLHRSHMIQYALELNGTMSGYDMISVELDKGNGELHYFGYQLSQGNAAKGVLRCFLEAAAKSEGVILSKSDWVNFESQMSSLKNGESFTLQVGAIQGQVDYYMGMYQVNFLPAEEWTP